MAETPDRSETTTTIDLSMKHEMRLYEWGSVCSCGKVFIGNEEWAKALFDWLLAEARISAEEMRDLLATHDRPGIVSAKKFYRFPWETQDV